MSLIRKHGAVLQAWACLDLVFQIAATNLRLGLQHNSQNVMRKKNDRRLLKMHTVEKRYGAKRFVAEFRRKKTGLLLLWNACYTILTRLDLLSSPQTGSGRRRTAHTDENVNCVGHLKVRLIEEWRCFLIITLNWHSARWAWNGYQPGLGSIPGPGKINCFRITGAHALRLISRTGKRVWRCPL